MGKPLRQANNPVNQVPTLGGEATSQRGCFNQSISQTRPRCSFSPINQSPALGGEATSQRGRFNQSINQSAEHGQGAHSVQSISRRRWVGRPHRSEAGSINQSINQLSTVKVLIQSNQSVASAGWGGHIAARQVQSVSRARSRRSLNQLPAPQCTSKVQSIHTSFGVVNQQPDRQKALSAVPLHCSSSSA